MKTKTYIFGVLLSGLIFINQGLGQTTTDIEIANKALRHLNKAAALNGVSLGFALASNIEMILIGGFPLEYDGGSNPEVNISHAILCTGRLSFSIFPPAQVSRARNELQPWRESPEKAPSFKKLFSYMDAAQILTAAAPVLSLAGGIMMFAGSQGDYENTHYYDPSIEPSYKLVNPGLKTAGWVLVGAGLAASISGAIMISLSRKELIHNMGTFKMTASPNGIGLLYNL